MLFMILWKLKKLFRLPPPKNKIITSEELHNLIRDICLKRKNFTTTGNLYEIFVGFDNKWYDPDWTDAFRGILDKIEKKNHAKSKKPYSEFNPITHITNKNMVIYYELESNIYKIYKIALKNQP